MFKIRKVDRTNNKGAFFTGEYRNVFKEYGYSETEIEAKVKDTWQQLFFGDEDIRFYHPVSDDMGYITDTGNNDVRTEGMSYGMMMAVQMDEKELFDRLWKWTKTYMWHDSGKYKGYFAWSCALDGSRNAQGPAPDGEEYFAMALLFASNRWGDGAEPFNYSEQAKDILHEVIHKGEDGGEGDPLWDPDNKLIKFVPECYFTDPSYHLPHFYELFSHLGNQEDRQFWSEAAEASRVYLRKACHPVTGLSAEYAHYDGSPEKTKGHQHFYSDSYRVAMNIGLDYEWFRADEWQKEEANKIQNFFANKEDYTKYTLNGRELVRPDYLHNVALIAANAMAALAGDGEAAKKSVDKFWNTPLRRDKRRYYDNCLYFFSLLALSGNYRIW
ncbi:glycosyl hydrolase family 8 [Halocella sp. SP3-1]|uniref:glycosyl hydrolase family 8 n=1 Tax=Halocella sp. SP3-1 TaxID=2382161 RepID=UPI00257012D0|nr:glycosyl hydrolase family 8 [Halocella sp. SP3-1]